MKIVKKSEKPNPILEEIAAIIMAPTKEEFEGRLQRMIEWIRDARERALGRGKN